MFIRLNNQVFMYQFYRTDKYKREILNRRHFHENTLKKEKYNITAL